MKSVSARPAEQNPSEQLMKTELLESIRGLLHCLSRRERDFFEAFFFEQLPPQDIADLFHTTTSNVYNHLSRSKKKVRKERVRVCIQDHLNKRKEQGCKAKVILEKPKL